MEDVIHRQEGDECSSGDEVGGGVAVARSWLVRNTLKQWHAGVGAVATTREVLFGWEVLVDDGDRIRKRVWSHAGGNKPEGAGAGS